jgi:hypothetical protein
MSSDTLPVKADADALLLAVNDESPLEQLAAASAAVDAMYERAKALREHRDALFADVCRRRGPFTLGTMRYWLSHPKTVRCRSASNAVGAILDATGGDEEAFARSLTSNPFKIGICRSLLGSSRLLRRN